MIPLADLKKQYQSIKSEIDAALAEVFESSQFVLGEQVEAFEKDFAGFCHARYALGVNSGTSALHLALLAAGIRPGDEVITVSYTFVATAAATCYTGARPVFVDIDPRHCTIDPKKIEAAITPRTKAILPVHLYGNCADMDAVLDIARRYGLIVIEDAAQAHGAEYKGRRAGSMGDIACFSFYPGKNLGAYGEAGAVVTNNADYAHQVKLLRDHGQREKYLHDVIGYNYRMEAIQGAVLKVKLRHLDEWTLVRRQQAEAYGELLSGTGLRLLEEIPDGKCVYHIFPVFTEQRDELQQHLKSAGVATGIHYPIPAHLQHAFEHLGYKAGDLPQTERASKEMLSLPIYPELPGNALSHIASSIRQFCEQTIAAHS